MKASKVLKTRYRQKSSIDLMELRFPLHARRTLSQFSSLKNRRCTNCMYLANVDRWILMLYNAI